MSDPMQRPAPTPPPPPPPADDPPRRGVNPLVWILLLIALVAFGWYFFNQRGTDVPPAVDPATLPATPVTSEQEAAAEREREASAARERAPARHAAPADRVASPSAEIRPEYPTLALRNRDEGSVTVEADVDATGAVTDARIVDRSRSRELDRAALDAVRAARFEPAVSGGRAVASTVRVPVDFRLEAQ